MDEPEIPDPYCNPDSPVVVTFDEITSAAYRIKSGIKNTECSKSEHLSNLTGMEIYIKKEFLQATGSFKERGARYAMMRMSPEMRSKGIVAASAGNHAQACCYHGLSLGVPVTVVMPETAPIMKIQKCRNYKGNVLVQGKNLTESKRLALAYARDHGMMYLNGYDHPHVLAGQGTIGLEVWEQVPDLDAVIVPCGGGGLLAGVCVAIKALNKDIQVIGVEPERASCLTEALRVGKPVEVKLDSTLADGLAVAKIGVNAFASLKNILDKCVTFKEQYVALAILRLVEYEKSVVEGAGASGLASILQGAVPELRGKKVCLILSGGNIDTTVLGKVLERGLAADGRLVKAKVCISDRVGGLEDLCNTIGDLGVHIKDLMHERAWVVEDVFKVEVKVICECRDREHSLNLRDILTQKYGTIYFNGQQYPEGPEALSTAVFAQVPHSQNVMPQIQSDFGKISVQQNVIDFDAKVGSTAGTSHASAQIGAGSVPPSFLPSLPGGFTPYQPTGGSFQMSQTQGSQNPSEPIAGSLHSSRAAPEPYGSQQQAGDSQRGGYTPGVSAQASQLPGSQQVAGYTPGFSVQSMQHTSQQVGASLNPSQAGCGPCGSTQVSQHPSQQVGGSIISSQAGCDAPCGSIQAVSAACGPCGSTQVSQHPSRQVGGSINPSQAGCEAPCGSIQGVSAQASQVPTACGPCGSVQVSNQPQQIGGSFQVPASSHMSQQIGGSTYPSQQVAGSLHPSQQSSQVGSSIHPSQVGQYAPMAPPMGDQFSQTGTVSVKSGRPNEIGVQKRFSSCSCKRRGAPGDYKS